MSTKSSTVERFVEFLKRSPTPHHSVAEGIKMLEAKGFTRLELADPPSNLPAGHLGYVQEETCLFAFRVGSEPVVEAGFRIIAAHTDSPNLRIKPQPLLKSHGYVRLGVEVYGGVMVPTWADRDLAVAGQVHYRDGDKNSRQLVNIRQAVCRIPTVAIHMNREVNAQGLKLNAQTQLPAVLTLDEGDEDPLRTLLGKAVGRRPEDILTWDLCLYDLNDPCVGGSNGEFVHSGRLDNLGCCFPALDALTRLVDEDLPRATSVIALFDHEEIGSQTARGANSRSLDNVLRRILRDSENQAEGTFSRALAHTWLISADMAHAVHPAYADKHDPGHMPLLNKGPAIKQNANRRYSTDGETAAMFVRLCEKAGIPYQWYVHRSDLRCGSTVGPMLAARLGVKSIDIGNPMLSMHSIREMSGSKDVAWMSEAMLAFCVDEHLFSS